MTKAGGWEVRRFGVRRRDGRGGDAERHREGGACDRRNLFGQPACLHALRTRRQAASGPCRRGQRRPSAFSLSLVEQQRWAGLFHKHGLKARILPDRGHTECRLRCHEQRRPRGVTGLRSPARSSSGLRPNSRRNARQKLFVFVNPQSWEICSTDMRENPSACRACCSRRFRSMTAGEVP